MIKHSIKTHVSPVLLGQGNMKGTVDIFHAVWMAAVLVILHSGYATAGALPLERRQGGVTVETDAWCDRMEVPGLTQKDCNTYIQALH